MKNTDSIPPAADSANFPSPDWRQLSFDFAPPPDSAPRALEPEPARAGPSCGSARNMNGHKALAAPDLSEPGKPAKPARKQRRKAAAKPVLTIVPPPVPDLGAEPDADPQVDPEATDGDPPKAAVASLKHERIARDPMMQDLHELLGQSLRVARESDKNRQWGGNTPEEEADYVKTWGIGVSNYCRVATTIHKHHEFLSKDD